MTIRLCSGRAGEVAVRGTSVDEGGHVTEGQDLPIKSVDRARSGGRRRGFRIVDSGRDQEMAGMAPCWLAPQRPPRRIQRREGLPEGAGQAQMVLSSKQY